MVGKRCLLKGFGVICLMSVWSKWKALNTIVVIRAVLKEVTHGLTREGEPPTHLCEVQIIVLPPSSTTTTTGSLFSHLEKEKGNKNYLFLSSPLSSIMFKV